MPKLTFGEQCDKIREAYKKGKRVVEIDGIFYDMMKNERNVTYSTGGINNRKIELHNTTETWLVVTRVDGKMAPMLNIEFTAGGNRRTKAAAA